MLGLSTSEIARCRTHPAEIVKYLDCFTVPIVSQSQSLHKYWSWQPGYIGVKRHSCFLFIFYVQETLFCKLIESLNEVIKWTSSYIVLYCDQGSQSFLYHRKIIPLNLCPVNNAFVRMIIKSITNFIAQLLTRWPRKVYHANIENKEMFVRIAHALLITFFFWTALKDSMIDNWLVHLH